MSGWSEPAPAAAAVLREEAGRIEKHLTQWFPSPAFARATVIGHHPILPEEAEVVARAVDRRKQEFSTGRWLSRQGLRRLGYADAAIVMGRLRNPVWPEGILGTISHDGGLCASVIMRRQDQGVTGIGVDLMELPQRKGRLEKLVPMFTASTDELDAVSAFDLKTDPALLLFSLKESVVKVLSPRLDDVVDMRDIRVSCENGLQVALAGERIGARMHAARTERHLVTAAIMPRAPDG